MTGPARVDSESPRRLVFAVRRLVNESEATASSAVVAVQAEVDAAQREVSLRERQLADARRRLAQAEAALAACRARPNANCSGPARAVELSRADVSRQEARVRVGREVLADVRRLHAQASTARNRLVAAQSRSADGAWRALASVSASVDAYLAGSPTSVNTPAGSAGTTSVAGGGVLSGNHRTNQASPSAPGSTVRFSSDVVARCWSEGVSTAAGRAYYEPSDGAMRSFAAALKPFRGEYTVDMHGSQTAVSVGTDTLDASGLAELVRADPAWAGRPVRLFSCNTGQGAHPIAQDLAEALGVRVTAPESLAWSDTAGDSWVGEKWRRVGGTLQRVWDVPATDGWRTFDP